MASGDEQAAQVDRAGLFLLPPAGVLLGGLITSVVTGIAVHLITRALFAKGRR